MGDGKIIWTQTSCVLDQFPKEYLEPSQTSVMQLLNS